MRLKQAFLCIGATFLMVSAALSQRKREILEEDPRLSPNLRFEISPFDIKTADPYLFFGTSLRVAYRANNKFSIVGEFRKEYSDGQSEDLKEITNGELIGNPKPYAGFGYELTGTWHFLAQEKETTQWLPIKSSATPVPTSKLVLYGLRGGYASDRATNTLGAEVSEVGVPSNVINKEVIPLQTRTFLFGGISVTNIKNIKVRYPSYGTRRKQFFREVYADILFGGNPNSATMVKYDDGGSGAITYYRIDSYELNDKTGWRIGILATATGRLVNCGYGLEVEKLPGGKGSINIKFILSLLKKIGLKEG